MDSSSNKEFPLFKRGASLSPPIFIPQFTTEPVIKEYLETTSKTVKMFWDRQVTSLEQDEESVTVKTIQTSSTDGEDAEEKVFRAKYLIGCDGGSSFIRKQLGIHTYGQFVVARACSITFRSPELFEYTRKRGRAGFYFAINNTVACLIILLNERADYAMHVFMPSDLSDEELDHQVKNASKIIENVIGESIAYTLVAASGYNMHALLSTKFQEGRCFLAGDSAHQWLPAGGLGLNTGIGDVGDLGWKLEAVLKGYGGPHLLDSYENERRPLVDSTRRFALNMGNNVIGNSQLVTNPILLTIIGKIMSVSFDKLFNVGNELVLGFHLSGSNIINHELDESGSVKVTRNEDNYVPSSLPGSRAPHVVLPDCESTLDLFGKKFVVLIIGGEETNLNTLKKQLDERGVPFDTHNYPPLPELVAVYDRKYFIIRPDGVVAWRGDYEPSVLEAKKIVSTMVGDLSPKRLKPPILNFDRPPMSTTTIVLTNLVTQYGLTALLAASNKLSFVTAGAVGLGAVFLVNCLPGRQSLWSTQRTSRHKAVLLTGFGQPDKVLKIEPAHVGSFGPKDVLIRVRAASVNVIDLKMRLGHGYPFFRALAKSYRKSFFPVILGRDCSGEVVAVGDEVTKFLPGDLVYAAVPCERQGTHTQLVAVGEDYVAMKPKNVDHKEAAALPYVASTAYTALVKLAGLNRYNSRGKRVLVHAGTGGVGSFAIQMLKAWGAEVTTTCSASNITLAHHLGADKVIDYASGDFSTTLKGYDVVLDPVCSEARSLRVLKWYGGATYVSVNSPRLALVTKLGSFLGELVFSWHYRFKVIINRLFFGRAFYYAFAEPSGELLEEVHDMVEKGEVKPLIDAVYTMDEIVDAHKHVEGGHTRGKVVITVP